MAAIIYTAPPTPPTPPTPPGAPDGSVQYNSSGTFAGISLLTSNATGDHAQYIAASTPTAPPQGNLILFADGDDGDNPITQINSWDKSFPLQNNIGHKIIGMAWTGSGTSITASFAWNGYINSTLGTWNNTNPLAFKNYALGTTLPNLSKQNGLTAAAINSGCEVCMITQARSVLVGAAAQAWGVKLILTFGLPTYKTDQRIFMGYSNVAATMPQNVDPSNNLNSIAIIKDQGDTNFQFFFRGAAGLTKVDTGITPVLNGVFRVTIYIPSTGAQAFINIQQILPNTITTAVESNNTTIPIPGTYLYPHFMANTGGLTATAVNLSFIQMYEEQL